MAFPNAMEVAMPRTPAYTGHRPTDGEREAKRERALSQVVNLFIEITGAYASGVGAEALINGHYLAPITNALRHLGNGGGVKEVNNVLLATLAHALGASGSNPMNIQSVIARLGDRLERIIAEY